MIRIFSLLALTGFLVACDLGPKSASGFRLPDGTPATGRATFVRLECHACHTVVGEDFPTPSAPGPVTVALGGDVTRVQTYGELVSSVINPSHKITRRYPEAEVSRDGESLMRRYNDEMTVQELTDLVAFLQSKYHVVVPSYQYPRF